MIYKAFFANTLLSQSMQFVQLFNQELGQLYGCSIAIEVILKDMGLIDRY